MNPTPKQQTYARVAGLAFLANFVLQLLGDFVTIIARGGESFVQRARYATEHELLWRVSLLEVGLAWIATGILAFALYVVLEGKLEVLKIVDGLERRIGRRPAGDVFGEIPIVFGIPFQGTFRATEPSRVMRPSRR